MQCRCRDWRGKKLITRIVQERYTDLETRVIPTSHSEPVFPESARNGTESDSIDRHESNSRPLSQTPSMPLTTTSLYTVPSTPQKQYINLFVSVLMPLVPTITTAGTAPPSTIAATTYPSFWFLLSPVSTGSRRPAPLRAPLRSCRTPTRCRPGCGTPPPTPTPVGPRNTLHFFVGAMFVVRECVNHTCHSSSSLLVL